MENRELIARLGETPLAEGLDDEALHRLAGTGEVREVARGEVLREEGLTAPSLFVLLDGEVEVLKDDERGTARCLVTMEENTVFGEIALLLDQPSSATIRTTQPATVFVLDGEALDELIGRDGAGVPGVTLSIARILARRLQRMNQEAVRLCSHYEEMLAEAGESKGSERVEELADFKQKLLTEWNF